MSDKRILDCGCEVTDDEMKPLTYPDLANRVVSLEAQITRLQDYAIDLAAHIGARNRLLIPDLQRDHLYDGDLDPKEQTR
jgi:hypothetical protein